MKGWGSRPSLLAKRGSNKRSRNLRLVSLGLFLAIVLISIACALSLPVHLPLISLPLFSTSALFNASGGSLEDLPGGGTNSDPGSLPLYRPLQVTIYPGIEKATGGYRYELSNAGDYRLRRVKIHSSDGRVLGILSRLDPGVTQTVVRKGMYESESGSITVTAIGSTGQEVRGYVDSRYLRQQRLESSDGLKPGILQSGVEYAASVHDENAEEPERLVCMSTQSFEEGATDESMGLNLTIRTNRSEGLAGEKVGFLTTLRNYGPQMLYNISLQSCEGQTTTQLLPPGREISLEGVVEINDSLEICANASGHDASGIQHSSKARLPVLMISPTIELTARTSPDKPFPGEMVLVTLCVKNSGNWTLGSVEVTDSLGNIGRLDSLGPGQSATIQRSSPVDSSLLDRIVVEARAKDGIVYGVTYLDISVQPSPLDVFIQPEKVTAYPDEPIDINWSLRNSGVEPLQNITIDSGIFGRARLNEVGPGKTVRMAARSRSSHSGTVALRASGFLPGGRSVFGKAEVFVQEVRPEIDISVMPDWIEVCPQEPFEFSCLVTNGGNDPLYDIALETPGFGRLAQVDELLPGDFKLFTPSFEIIHNRSFTFTVTARDSRGQIYSGQANASAVVVSSAMDLDVRSSQKAVRTGQSATVTCRIENRGIQPLQRIQVASKRFGHLGTVDALAPKSEYTVTVQVPVEESISDIISAEGFGSNGSIVSARAGLDIALLNEPDRILPRAATPARAAFSASQAARAYELSSKVAEAEGSNTTFRIQGSDPSAGIDEGYMNGISGLIQYVRSMFTGVGLNGTMREGDVSLSVESAGSGSRLSKSRVEAPEVLDVVANPPSPESGTPVKISVHARAARGVSSVSVRWGIADQTLARSDMLDMEESKTIPLTRDSGTKQDGYWTCLIPGQREGTFVVISISVSDGYALADDGPYILRWVGKGAAGEKAQDEASLGGASQSKGSQAEKIIDSSMKVDANGMLFIESSTVSGHGEVSIRDNFMDSSIGYKEDLKGFGSINMETERLVIKSNPSVNFSQSKDIIFDDGFLKGFKRLESPGFHGGMGASITERFNTTQLDKSEQGMIRRVGNNKNTLAFSTEQAFNGTLNTQTQYARFNKKLKEDQRFTGIFQTQKSVKFQD